VLVVLAFYLPKPLLDLIRSASSVVAGGSQWVFRAS